MPGRFPCGADCILSVGPFRWPIMARLRSFLQRFGAQLVPTIRCLGLLYPFAVKLNLLVGLVPYVNPLLSLFVAYPRH